MANESRTLDYAPSMECPECNLRDKHSIAKDYYHQMVNRLDSMFRWTGLPDTIPERFLERYLKLNGWCGIGRAPDNACPEYRGQLFCFYGGLGIELDPYYQPTAIILANPVLGSKTYTIGKDVVWAKNDSGAIGLSQHLARYSHLLAANDLSINVAQVTTRTPYLITAETDAEAASAKEFIKQAEEGRLGIIKSSAFNNGVKPYGLSSQGAGDYIKALIELHQYLKAQWSIDIGVSMGFNMKRERQNTAEIEMNSPYLLPLVDDMLKYRRQICDEVHAMFPEQKWSVELNSAWELELKTQELKVESMRLDNEGGGEENDTSGDADSE